MNSVAARAGLMVAGVGVLAALMAVGYLSEKGLGQLYAPGVAGNDPPRTNRPYRDNSAPQRDSQTARDPIPKSESVWEDYAEEDLDFAPRLPERPGNFDVITRVGQFYEGRYQVEPKYTDHAAYPLWLARERFESAEAFAAKWKASEDARRQSGNKQKNKLRQYNVIINGLALQRFGPGDSALTNPKDNGLSERDIETFAEVRKAHGERCYLVMIDVQGESLQSEKIEGGGKACELLCYVQKADGWKMVWWRKG